VASLELNWVHRSGWWLRSASVGGSAPLLTGSSLGWGGALLRSPDPPSGARCWPRRSCSIVCPTRGPTHATGGGTCPRDGGVCVACNRGCQRDEGVPSARGRICYRDDGVCPARSRGCSWDEGGSPARNRGCQRDKGVCPARNRGCQRDEGACRARNRGCQRDNEARPANDRPGNGGSGNRPADKGVRAQRNGWLPWRCVPRRARGLVRLSSAAYVAVDATSVHWATKFAASNSIGKVAIGGGTPTTLASGLDNVWAIKSDGTNVYFSTYGTHAAVVQMPTN
jgi:hypothetical protein